MKNCGYPGENGSEFWQRLEAFAERSATQERPWHNLDGDPALPAFLTFCADSLRAESQHLQESAPRELIHLRDLFMRAGLDALADRSVASDDWLQIGIQPAGCFERQGELYRQIALFAGWLLHDGVILNFFFMHKPPGFRLRFQSTSGCSRDVGELIRAEVARWRVQGLIGLSDPGIYEPESRLFGGPRSMPFVHALFTVDSLLWLEFHHSHISAGEELSPAWLLSLVLLHIIFSGLQIVGWEDIGVWDQITNRTGRHLDDNHALPDYSSLRAEICRIWSEQDRMMDLLHPVLKDIVNRRADALRTGAAQWRSGYFNQPEALIGPRAAVAFYVIFHWNRAALSPIVQALLATSLAEREL